MVKLSGSQINQFVEESYKPKASQNIDGYQLDKELSNRKAKVYHNPQNDKTIVVNRGTTGTASDWMNNVRYLTGTYDDSDRLKQAERTQREAITKYGKVDTNIGHSQGGIIFKKTQ